MNWEEQWADTCDFVERFRALIAEHEAQCGGLIEIACTKKQGDSHPNVYAICSGTNVVAALRSSWQEVNPHESD